MKCVVEEVGMRVCKEGVTWKIWWEDRGDGKMREGYASWREESNIMFFFSPPRKTEPLFFNYTHQKRESPFFRQLIKINQYNYNCTSSIYSVPVQKKKLY